MGLKGIRTKHKPSISGYQLSIMAGVPRSVISEIENTEGYNPTFGTLHKLVKALAELGVVATEGDLVDAEY